MIHCQRCDPSDGVLAEWKVHEYNAEDGRTLRFWYLCDAHLQEDYGPWLRSKRK